MFENAIRIIERMLLLERSIFYEEFKKVVSYLFGNLDEVSKTIILFISIAFFIFTMLVISIRSVFREKFTKLKFGIVCLWYAMWFKEISIPVSPIGAELMPIAYLGFNAMLIWFSVIAYSIFLQNAFDKQMNLKTNRLNNIYSRKSSFLRDIFAVMLYIVLTIILSKMSIMAIFLVNWLTVDMIADGQYNMKDLLRIVEREQANKKQKILIQAAQKLNIRIKLVMLFNNILVLQRAFNIIHVNDIIFVTFVALPLCGIGYIIFDFEK